MIKLSMSNNVELEQYHAAVYLCCICNIAQIPLLIDGPSFFVSTAVICKSGNARPICRLLQGACMGSAALARVKPQSVVLRCSLGSSNTHSKDRKVY